MPSDDAQKFPDQSAAGGNAASNATGANPATPPPGWVPPEGWVPPPGWYPPPAPRKRPKWVLPVASLVVLAILGGGIVGFIQHRESRAAEARVERAEAKAAADKQAEEEAAAQAAAEVAAEEQRQAETLRQARGVFKDCQGQVSSLYEALTAIDSRLDVGVTQAEFLGYVGDASVAYGTIRIPKLGDGACLSAAAKMESAFNEYSATATTWNDCITDFDCDTDDITPGMQVKWSKSSNLLRQSARLMQTMNPDHKSYNAGAAGNLG